MSENQVLTRTDIVETLDCPAWVVDYLNNCRRLPIAKQTRGRGFPRLYKPEALEIVRDHLEKRARQ